MVEMSMHGGPLDGRVFEVPHYEPEFYVYKQVSAIESFLDGGPGMPPSDKRTRLTYERQGDTGDYICAHMDRAQEVINFCRSIGVELLDWQQRVLQHWFAENPGETT